MIDRKFVTSELANLQVFKLPKPQRVKGIGEREHDASDYIMLPLYFTAIDGRRALIERECYIVDKLTAKALIGVNILKPERIVIDFDTDLMTIKSCRDIQVPFGCVSKQATKQATVFSKKRIIVPPHSRMAVPVVGAKHRPLQLPKDRDFLFEPSCLDSLTTFAHVVDYKVNDVLVQNSTDYNVVLGRKTRLGNLEEYEATSCYRIDTK